MLKVAENYLTISKNFNAMSVVIFYLFEPLSFIVIYLPPLFLSL